MAQSRREFLRSAVGIPALLSLSGRVPAFLVRTARAADTAPGDQRPDTCLVVLQLTGGNDGLNTVVPYADDIYARNRSTLRLRAGEVLKIDDYAGFHPRMEGLARLMTDGRLTVVQGVGYPNSSRDHERALRDWHSARPDEPRCPTGWLGRAIDGVCGPDPAAVPGVFVGPIAQPFALNARQAVVPSINSAADLTAVEETAPLAPVRPAEPNPLATYLRQCADGAAAMSRRIQATLRQTPAVDHYGQAGLAAQLKTVAQLIRANVGIRIFLVELGGGGLGGFDNHANQRDNHAALLKQFSDSTAAFADDLAADKLLDRVVLMTFSEFGRTVSENGRRGTDHGAAAPVFLVGGRLRPGLIGPRPNLTDLDQDAPRTQVDFRGLYATVLDRWLGLNSEAILGARFKPLDLFLP